MITLELQSMFIKFQEIITIAKYMKELEKRSKLSKKFKVLTNSNQNFLIVDKAFKEGVRNKTAL